MNRRRPTSLARMQKAIADMQRVAESHGMGLTPAGELVSRIRLIADHPDCPESIQANLLLALHRYDIACCPPDMAGDDTEPVSVLGGNRDFN